MRSARLRPPARVSRCGGDRRSLGGDAMSLPERPYGGHGASSASEPSPVQLLFSFFQRLTKGAAVIPGSQPTAGEKDPRFTTGTV